MVIQLILGFLLSLVVAAIIFIERILYATWLRSRQGKTSLCTTCGHVGKPNRQYRLWRQMTKQDVCPHCHNPTLTLIPINRYQHILPTSADTFVRWLTDYIQKIGPHLHPGDVRLDGIWEIPNPEWGPDLDLTQPAELNVIGAYEKRIKRILRSSEPVLVKEPDKFITFWLRPLDAERVEVNAWCREPAVLPVFQDLVEEIEQRWPAEEKVSPSEEQSTEDKPWKKIPDLRQDRKLVKLWHDGLPMKKIGKKLGMSPKTVRNRLSELRKIYGEEIVPYRQVEHEDEESE
ncbi:MAG: helix-turn-helix transcriptional regulator [Candidatus Bipolaricaulia bacterium]